MPKKHKHQPGHRKRKGEQPWRTGGYVLARMTSDPNVYDADRELPATGDAQAEIDRLKAELEEKEQEINVARVSIVESEDRARALESRNAFLIQEHAALLAKLKRVEALAKDALWKEVKVHPTDIREAIGSI